MAALPGKGNMKRDSAVETVTVPLTGKEKKGRAGLLRDPVFTCGPFQPGSLLCLSSDAESPCAVHFGLTFTV